MTFAEGIFKEKLSDQEIGWVLYAVISIATWALWIAADSGMLPSVEALIEQHFLMSVAIMVLTFFGMFFGIVAGALITILVLIPGLLGMGARKVYKILCR